MKSSLLNASILTLVFVVLLAYLNFMVWRSFSPSIAHENHIMENIQAGSLFLGFLLYFFISYKSKARGYKILFMGLALFYLTFCMREVEFDKFEFQLALFDVFNPPIRNYWLGATWLVAFLVFVRNAMISWRAFLHWVKSLQGALVCIAGVFYLAGDLFDKHVFDLSNMFYEEILESNATTLMILAAVLSLRWAQRSAWWGPPGHKTVDTDGEFVQRRT
jgi:hypothetical protein